MKHLIAVLIVLAITITGTWLVANKVNCAYCAPTKCFTSVDCDGYSCYCEKGSRGIYGICTQD